MKIILKIAGMIVGVIESSFINGFCFLKTHTKQTQFRVWRMNWTGAILESGQLIGGCGIGLGSMHEDFIRQWQWGWRKWGSFLPFWYICLFLQKKPGYPLEFSVEKFSMGTFTYQSSNKCINSGKKLLYNKGFIFKQ